MILDVTGYNMFKNYPWKSIIFLFMAIHINWLGLMNFCYTSTKIISTERIFMSQNITKNHVYHWISLNITKYHISTGLPMLPRKIYYLNHQQIRLILLPWFNLSRAMFRRECQCHFFDKRVTFSEHIHISKVRNESWWLFNVYRH